MQPHEIGHAAAYEAYRTWIHNSSIYEPLSGDIERQREALTGLAVAEGTYSDLHVIFSHTNYLSSFSLITILLTSYGQLRSSSCLRSSRSYGFLHFLSGSLRLLTNSEFFT